MKLIRRVLVKVLGLNGYLRLISSTYLSLMSLGFFKKKYAELHFIKSIIKPSYTVLDIGANLGYYSYFMAGQIQKEGRLIAVEPIPLFANIWKKNMRRYLSSNMQLFNCALGEEQKTQVDMSIPIVNGIVRHGLTQINSQDNGASQLSYQVPMEVGDDIINSSDISSLDYLKCDVEGYEQYVIPSLKKTISQYKPTVQIELNGVDNRETVVAFLMNYGYGIYVLDFNKLLPISKEEIHTFNQDFYFIHSDKVADLEHLII